MDGLKGKGIGFVGFLFFFGETDRSLFILFMEGVGNLEMLLWKM